MFYIEGLWLTQHTQQCNVTATDKSTVNKSRHYVYSNHLLEMMKDPIVPFSSKTVNCMVVMSSYIEAWTPQLGNLWWGL